MQLFPPSKFGMITPSSLESRGQVLVAGAPLELYILNENRLADSEWDHAIRGTLCLCFPDAAAVFSQTRAWHSVPTYAAFLAEGREVVAHAAIVRRTVTWGGENLVAAGPQGVCVHPKFRGKGLLQVVLGGAMKEAAEYDLGLLFCLPQLAKVYAALGWRAMANTPIICHNEDGANEPLPSINIPMDLPLRRSSFPNGPVHLNGRDW